MRWEAHRCAYLLGCAPRSPYSRPIILSSMTTVQPFLCLKCDENAFEHSHLLSPQAPSSDHTLPR